jgi:hypothetical protein
LTGTARQTLRRNLAFHELKIPGNGGRPCAIPLRGERGRWGRLVSSIARDPSLDGVLRIQDVFGMRAYPIIVTL